MSYVVTIPSLENQRISVVDQSRLLRLSKSDGRSVSRYVLYSASQSDEKVHRTDRADTVFR